MILFLVIFLPFSMMGQRSTKKFYHKYKKSANTINFAIPGFVMGLGASIARKHVEKEDRLAFELTKSIKSARFMVMEETNLVSQKDYTELIAGLKKRDKMEDLISIRADGAKVNIMVREKRKHISNLLILVSEEDTFVMVSLKTRLRYKDLNKFLKEIMKSDEKIKVDVPEDPEEMAKKVVPRA